MIRQSRMALSSGITINCAEAGPVDAPPVILLHGFPESHRTWRALVPLLEDRFRLIMPDLRGFGDSDRPQQVADYSTANQIADLLALAEARGLDRFALVGHDWGGAVAWAAAIRGDPRIERLCIINAPHPWIFQTSQIDDPDQRAASQYIRAFRDPAMEARVAAMGFDTFFDKSFSRHVDPSDISAEERAVSIAQWSRPGALTAMFNWYRASHLIVPPPGATVPMPDWVSRAMPRIQIPVRIIWGLADKALLPVQLDGIGEVGDDVEVVPLKGVGHFAPWQAPRLIAAALAPFLDAARPATGAAS